ncbi:hypothetical protein [Streptomyces cyaneus]|uniref:hypothetical protein n=1 Tax=Streptomyces cyaneus TaxID=1904 RepID=UPI000FF8B09A|nr:hypothetical protein [Streptomyces cyaneus]
MGPAEGVLVILDGLDRALEETGRSPRRRRTRIGWRQVAVQALFFVAVTAVVVALLSYGSADR